MGKKEANSIFSFVPEEGKVEAISICSRELHRKGGSCRSRSSPSEQAHLIWARAIGSWTLSVCFLSTFKGLFRDKSPLNVLRIRVQVVLLLAKRTYLSNAQRGGNGHGVSQESARFAAGRDNRLR